MNRQATNLFAWGRPFARLLVVAPLVWATGCPTTPTDNINDNAAGNVNDNAAAVEAEILGIQSNFPISALDEPISVQYSVVGDPDQIDAFYRPVADGTVGAGATGPDVVFQTGLTAGSQQAFSFDPATVEVGFYKVGLVITVSGQQTRVVSTGTIQVQGPPSPVFILPAQALTQVEEGTDVDTSFDAGDPEGDVQWRLFYLAPGDSTTDTPDVIGTALATGSGNVGQATLTTDGFEPGIYQFGVSATDTGSSISTTVSDGLLQRIVTVLGPQVEIIEPEPEPLPPTITILSPGSSDVTLFMDEPFTISFSGQVLNEGSTGLIDVFWDLDNNFNNGFTLIAADLPTSTTTVAFPTDLAEGTYYVGASIRDEFNTVTTYATGRIIVVRTATLEVTAPADDVTITPTLPGETAETVTLNWTTNVPESAGTVEAFARTVDANGIAFGAEIEVLPAGSSLSVTTATFSSDTSGRYELTVRITFDDETLEPLEESAPGLVRVTSLPAILWLGELVEEDRSFDGAIFEGVNFEDNAGSAFAPAGDLNGDGPGEFVIAARYGKSLFTNPSSIGWGEAYVIYGGSAGGRLTGSHNLNSIGTTLTGVTLVGIRTPQGNSETDGLTVVTALPDLDNDGNSELMFGFPDVDSRGHNVSFLQDGVRDPAIMCTLEKEEQFLNGGVVIVSSKNSILENPLSGSPSIFLDMVGQDFDITDVRPEPGEEEEWAEDFIHFDDTNGCVGDCVDPQGGDAPADSAMSMDKGFNETLAGDYITTFVFNGCAEAEWYGVDCAVEYCGSSGLYITEPSFPLLSLGAGLTGFYPTNVTDGEDEDPVPNNPREPLGARIIGIGRGDSFGTTATLTQANSDGTADIIISAPDRTARGSLFGEDFFDPSNGGEVEGLESPPGTPVERLDSGVAYLFELRNLWEQDNFGRIPPKPHQYMVGQPSHVDGVGGEFDPFRLPNIDALRIAGQANERIRNILGIDDFNNDGRDDFAVGAPTANGGTGRVYVTFRREESIEGDYVLEKLAEDPNDVDRLTGVLIVSESTSALGTSVATGLDFNADGLSDLIISAPNASGGVGEVIVVFGDPNLVSPVNGVTVTTLLTTRNAAGLPRAARITGNAIDVNSQFGFNIANAGDVDGDGTNDLLVAAPNATPRFDPDPFDDTDELISAGVDLNFDGIADDVSGPLTIPDGSVDSFDELTNAGVVYIVYGSNRLDQLGTSDFTISISELGSPLLRGYMIAGRRAGDRIGGGDGGDVNNGGNAEKTGRGRSIGLSTAGDVDGDGFADILIGSILADPRIDPTTGVGVVNGGEAYLVYGAGAQ